MAQVTTTGQSDDVFEALIQGLLNQGFGSSPHFLPEPVVSQLRAQLRQHYDEGNMSAAGIGRHFDYQKNAEIRGDEIRWIRNDTPNPAEKSFLQTVDAFVDHLNATCYAGIRSYEFHYAYYAPGSFYKRHLDQFRSDKGRKYSLVIYLNENWQKEDGGHLSLYVDGDKQIDVLPTGGRAVFFKSDEREHEVHPAPERYRLSIAGWLKNV